MILLARSFFAWRTDSGDKITDRAFDLLLERNTGVYATYSNWKGDYGKWEPCDSKAPCSEYAVSYRKDSSTGLKEFRVDNSGGHYFNEDNKTIIKENTCTTYGLCAIKCEYCGETYEEIIEPCHKMSPYTVYEKASGAKHGKMRTTCERCGYYEEKDYISAIVPDTRNYNIKYDYDDYYNNHSYACRTEEHWKTDNEYMYKIHHKSTEVGTYQVDYLYFADHGKNSPVYVRTVKNKGASAYDVYRTNSSTNFNNWAVLTYLDCYEEFEAFVDSNSLANTGRNSSTLYDLFHAWESYYNIYGMSEIGSATERETWTYRDFTAKNVTVYTTTSDEIFVVDENNCCLYHSDTGFKGGYSPRPYEGIVSMERIDKITEDGNDVPEPNYKDVVYYALDCNALSYNMSGYQTSWYVMQSNGYDTTFDCMEKSLLNSGEKFVAWERYNWDTGAWDVISTEPIARIGAYKRTHNGAQVVAPLRIRMKTEKLPCDIKVSTTDGLKFRFDDDYGLTSANVYAGATIYLDSSVYDEDGKESYIESYTVKTPTDTYQIYDSFFEVNENVVITPVFQEDYAKTIGVNIQDGEWGHGYFDNEYDDEYYSWADAYAGDKLWVNLVNYEGFDEEQYKFIGWFYCDREMGDIGELISTDERFELTVEDADNYISIKPVYMEIGGKDPRNGNVIRVTNGFVRNGRNYRAPLYVSSIVVPNESNVSVKYDPTVIPYATKFIITFDGEEPYEEYREYDEIDIWNVNSDLTIEGVSTDHTEHNWSSWWYNYDNQETHIRSCICGITETQNHIDENSDNVCDICDNDIHTHSFAEEYMFSSKTHWNECSCGQKKNEQAHIDDNSDGNCDICGFSKSHKHSYTVTEIAPDCVELGTRTYTCACGNKYSEPIAALGHDLKTIPAVKATCYKTGLTEGKQCTRCDHQVRQKSTPMLSHSIKTTVTKATTTADGKIVKQCTNNGCTYKATTSIKKISTIKLSTTSYTYDGKAKSPTLTIKDSAGKALIKGTDYTVTTPSGRKDTGIYTYKITFKGNYSGTKSLSFNINPKTTSISSLTAESKGFTVKWKKQATQTTGYQIQYSKSSTFASGNTLVTVSSKTTTSKKITKLKAKTKYYVRIRTYKKTSTGNVYSAWSTKKMYVKTK